MIEQIMNKLGYHKHETITVAECAKCHARYEPKKPWPKTGVLCPECREAGHIAVGVVHLRTITTCQKPGEDEHLC